MIAIIRDPDLFRVECTKERMNILSPRKLNPKLFMILQNRNIFPIMFSWSTFQLHSNVSYNPLNNAEDFMVRKKTKGLFFFRHYSKSVDQANLSFVSDKMSFYDIGFLYIFLNRLIGFNWGDGKLSSFLTV